jgi:hypothetical protein
VILLHHQHGQTGREAVGGGGSSIGEKNGIDMFVVRSDMPIYIGPSRKSLLSLGRVDHCKASGCFPT